MNISGGLPCGLAYAYEGNPEITKETWRDGYYHTGDTAWRDSEGYYWMYDEKVTISIIYSKAPKRIYS